MNRKTRGLVKKSAEKRCYDMVFVIAKEAIARKRAEDQLKELRKDYERLRERVMPPFLRDDMTNTFATNIRIHRHVLSTVNPREFLMREMEHRIDDLLRTMTRS